MPDHPPVHEFTRRELTVILGGMIVAGVLVVLLTWYLIDFFFSHDPSDPLAKAGGLKVEQIIRK